MRRVSGALVLSTLALVTMVGSGDVSAQSGVFPQSVASGDPRPDSVVLWTRLDSPTDEYPQAVTLEVAADEDFASPVQSRELVAEAEYDGAVKVRVTGLEPYTTYYYRFVYGEQSSPVGRTRTAPTADMDVEVRFAVVYCQDYIDRWYNAYLKMLLDHDDEVDFVVFLGDYIYETTGDPAFQDPGDVRGIVFDDVDGAIVLPDGGLAAASLANYRTLYRTYRSDPVLQQVHERWPMIAIWDDHEFSNDAWQANATYFNGLVDEHEVERKRVSEQAFYEWVPTELALGEDGTLEVDASVLFPNSGVYRTFRFGRNLELVLTDTRTFRPDHLVPEDAYPGAIAVEQEMLEQILTPEVFAAVRGSFDPYVDMDVLGRAFPILRQTVVLATAVGIVTENPQLDLGRAQALADSMVHGNLSTTFLNELFAAAGLTPVFTADLTANLPRGVSFLYIGKTGFFTSVGSRVAALHDTFNLYAVARYLETGGAAQEVFGSLQAAQLQGDLLASDAAWKVLANSVMMTPLVIDFTNPAIAPLLPDGFPDQLRTRLDVNIEDFNGFPQKRQELLGLLGLVPNAVVISGDIHSSFVTDHGDGVFEFTGPAISSATQREEVLRFVQADPILGQVPGLEALLDNLAQLLQLSSLDDVNVSPSDIVFADTSSHGFMMMTAKADELRVGIKLVPDDAVATRYYDDPEALDELFTTVHFKVQDGQLIPF